MSRTKASMINSSVRNSLISPEASWQRLRLMTEHRALERQLNRERESCTESQKKKKKKRRGDPSPPPPHIKRKKITRVIKGGCICSAAEDLSSSFLVGEADSRREQDKEKSWSGLRLPGACLGQQRAKAQRTTLHRGQGKDRRCCIGQEWVSVYCAGPHRLSNALMCALTEEGKPQIFPAETILQP